MLSSGAKETLSDNKRKVSTSNSKARTSVGGVGVLTSHVTSHQFLYLILNASAH